MGQGVARVEGERVVLGTACLVSDDDNVRTLRQDRAGFAALSPEFLNRSENAAVVLIRQPLAQASPIL